MQGSNPQLLSTAVSLYGENLSAANPSELIDILSGCVMELECRLGASITSNTMQHLHDIAMDASNDDILTLAIAAAIRLRLPNLSTNTQILTPLIPVEIAA